MNMPEMHMPDASESEGRAVPALEREWSSR
jgi:hypothetical protein